MKFLLTFLFLSIPTVATAETPPIVGTFDVPLEKLVSVDGVEGTVNVDASFTPIDKGMVKAVEFKSAALFYKKIPFGAFRAKVSERSDGPSQISATFTSLFGTFVASGWGPVSVDLKTQKVVIDEGLWNANFAGKIDLTKAPLGDFSGNLEMTALVSGTTKEPVILGTIVAPKMSYQNGILDRTRLTWSHKGRRSSLKIETKYGDIAAVIPIDIDLSGAMIWLREEPLKIATSLEKIPTEVISALAPIPNWIETSIDLTVDLEGKLSELEGAFKSAGTITVGSATEPFALTIGTSKNSQSVEGSFGDSSLKFTTAVDWTEIDKKSDAWKTAPLEGVLTLNLNNSAWLEQIPGVVRATGVTTGEVKLGGTLGAVKADGEFSTKEATLTSTSLNRNFENVNLESTVSGSTFSYRLSGDAANDPKSGFVVASGEVDFGAEVRRDRHSVVFTKTPFVRPKYAIGRLNGSVVCEVEAMDNRDDVGCVLANVQVDVSNESLPRRRDIATNPNIRFTDGADENSSGTYGLRDLKVDIELKTPLMIVGDGVSIGWVGDVSVERIGSRIFSKSGLVTTPESRVSLFENEMGVAAGRAMFAEGDLRRKIEPDDNGFRQPAPMDPIIEIVVEGKVVDTYVLARMIGNPKRPRLELGAIPPLPEYQIVTLLVTGKPDSVDDRNGNVRRVVAKMVDRYHAPSLQRQLFDRLGIDKIGFKFGKSVLNPILTVGKQITRRLYFETTYRHDVPPDVNTVEGRAEQQLTSKWTVDTTFGDAAEGSAGLFWSTRFGGPVAKPPTDEQRRLRGPERSDRDEDGVEQRFDLCSNEKEDLDGFEDEDGCEDRDNDEDGIVDAKDAAPNEREVFNGFEDGDGAPDVIEAEVANPTLVLPSLVFEYRKTALTREHREALVSFLSVLEQFPQGVVAIRGYSDTRSDEKARARVAERRADNVAKFLKRRGLSEDLFEVTFSPDPPEGVAEEFQRQVSVGFKTTTP